MECEKEKQNKKNHGRWKCGTLKGFAWNNVRKAERLRPWRKTESLKLCSPPSCSTFTLMTAFLSSFLLVFLSTRYINTDNVCFSWGISKSQFFFAPFVCLMIFVSLLHFVIWIGLLLDFESLLLFWEFRTLTEI